MKPTMISLCDESGVMAQPWAEAGYPCICVDMVHRPIRKPRVEGNITYQYGDVRFWTPPPGIEIAFVAAFPSCTHVTVADARDFKLKGPMLLMDSIELWNACHHAGEWSRAPYFVENPVGVLSSHIRKPDHYFDPCDYGDPYTKKTCLWTGGGFVMPPRSRVEPVLGSKMHTMPPGPDRARIRSETPVGFPRAVFEANRPCP